MQRTELHSLGEFGLIDRIQNNIKLKNASTIKGIGDDAAVIDLGNDQVMVVSTDTLVEGIHFDLTYTPLKHLGFKSVAVNVSDICAMNAKAEQITVSLALSNRFSVEAIDELYAGFQAACDAYQVDLVGGDTTSSTSGLIITITAIGRCNKNQVAYRSGAQVGDLICVTGDLGAAFLGLTIMEREKEVAVATNNDFKPELEGFEYLVQRLLKPEARVDIIDVFHKNNFVPTSMIDVSDGLASELLHISKSSNVGILLKDESLPIDNATYETAVSFNIDPATCALNGGEDYELLFTCSVEEYQKIKPLTDVWVIGDVMKPSDGCFLITREENQYPITAQGWTHF